MTSNREPSSSESTAAPPVRFHGWRIVGYASVALAMTAPGQTLAVSAFIDPMIADLGMTRSTVSTAYLVGTLAGAAALPGIGILIDRYGVRRCMAVIGAVFGTVLIALSLVTGIVGLTAGFVGIRLAGQGALGIAATTVTAHWFLRRRGTALAIVSAVGTTGISLAPLLLERLIALQGWRTAWLIEGLVVWAVVIPIALLGIRDRPADVGQFVDGQPPTRAGGDSGPVGVTRARALRTPYFWILAAAVATAGMLTTAVGFHQISLLTERGLSTTAAAANFLPQTVAGLAATLLVGPLVDGRHPRALLAVAMAGLGTALTWATLVTPGWSAIGFGVAIGAASAAIRTVETALTPRLFGTAHLGAIRGLLTAITVGSTAFGPLLFALVHDATGGYQAALLGCAALPVAVGLAALATPLPTPPANGGAPTPARSTTTSGGRDG
ncbi:sugar phosphate permease [Micromonospora sp. Llam0]|uniref:MFS transporter n=1 Tax=Micromonospora sp. Llam0 TaxID=2485143 RepID=UPI000FBC8E7B|nr:MFS transporter [Micromonospora sp. Llam0]ROO63274.1 sugar phosphate permease [Micromonospora sp. Llam0]